MECKGSVKCEGVWVWEHIHVHSLGTPSSSTHHFTHLTPLPFSALKPAPILTFSVMPAPRRQWVSRGVPYTAEVTTGLTCSGNLTSIEMYCTYQNGG